MSVPDGKEKAVLALVERGIAASAETLARLSGVNWATHTREVSSDEAEAFRRRLEKDDAPHYGAFLSAPGAIFAFMAPQDRALALAAAFFGARPGSPDRPAPREEDCVSEIANIVTHAVANVLADACGQTLMLSAPAMAVGGRSRLVGLALDELKASGESRAVFSFVNMTAKSLSSDCTLALLMTPSFRGRLLKAVS